jgi:hypothetical protein
MRKRRREPTLDEILDRSPTDRQRKKLIARIERINGMVDLLLKLYPDPLALEHRIEEVMQKSMEVEGITFEQYRERVIKILEEGE